MKNFNITVLFLIFFAFNIFAGSRNTAGIGNPSRLIGMDIESAYELLGPPVSLQTLRGEEEWQDDVVFFFDNSLYLYWFENRIWQVRIDENSPLSWNGIKPGLNREEIQAILGKPFQVRDDWEIYFLSELPFPLRLRIFYREGRAVDFYLYRGDF